MIINNESVNKLIRHGESDATFSLHPRIEDIVDESGRFKQLGPRVPVLDAIRALLARARHLHPGLIHPSTESGLSVSKDLWEAVVVSLERVAPMQAECFDGTPHKVAAEVKSAKDSYAVAVTAFDALEKNPRLSMDEFVKIISSSPNEELSAGILCQAGEGNAGWITANGVLPPLETAFPQTLAPERDVEIQGYIRDVDDANCIALVEITAYRDKLTEKLIRHHASRVPMQFDKQSIDRDDLIIIQYLEQPVWLRAAAVCAVAPKFSRKTVLSLSRILMARASLDLWHTKARQTSLPFTDSR